MITNLERTQRRANALTFVVARQGAPVDVVERRRCGPLAVGLLARALLGKKRHEGPESSSNLLVLARGPGVRYPCEPTVTSAPPKRILVVDDDVAILRLIARALTEDGYEVVTTTDGHDALAECERAPFALILLDLMMPKMDGETFLTRLRARFGEGAPPVVVLSASFARADVARAHYAVATLEKPFELEDVRELVETLLVRSSRP